MDESGLDFGERVEQIYYPHMKKSSTDKSTTVACFLLFVIPLSIFLTIAAAGLAVRLVW